MTEKSTQIITIDGDLRWFSPVIPEENYEILIGGVDLIHEVLPLDESEANRDTKKGEIGPWFRLKGKKVKLTIEITDEV